MWRSVLKSIILGVVKYLKYVQLWVLLSNIWCQYSIIAGRDKVRSNRSIPSVYTCTGNGIVWKYLPHLASSWEKVKVRLYWSQGHKPNDGVFFVCTCIKQWKKGRGQLLLCTVLFCGVSVVSFTFSYLHHVQWTLNSCCYKQYILLW